MGLTRVQVQLVFGRAADEPDVGVGNLQPALLGRCGCEFHASGEDYFLAVPCTPEHLSLYLGASMAANSPIPLRDHEQP